MSKQPSPKTDQLRKMREQQYEERMRAAKEGSARASSADATPTRASDDAAPVAKKPTGKPRVLEQQALPAQMGRPVSTPVRVLEDDEPIVEKSPKAASTPTASKPAASAGPKKRARKMPELL